MHMGCLWQYDRLRTLGGEVTDMVIQNAAVAVAVLRVGRSQKVALLDQLRRYQGNDLQVFDLYACAFPSAVIAIRIVDPLLIPQPLLRQSS